MRGHIKFVVSSILAVLWLGISVAISIVWIRDVIKVVPAWYAVWVIIGIALLPGYLMSAMFISNIANTHLEKIDCSDAGAICIIICARNEQATIYKTIERIASQRYSSHIRILCVDNASKDETSKEIRRAARAYQSQVFNSSALLRNIRQVECIKFGIEICRHQIFYHRRCGHNA